MPGRGLVWLKLSQSGGLINRSLANLYLIRTDRRAASPQCCAYPVRFAPRVWAAAAVVVYRLMSAWLIIPIGFALVANLKRHDARRAARLEAAV